MKHKEQLWLKPHSINTNLIQDPWRKILKEPWSVCVTVLQHLIHWNKLKSSVHCLSKPVKEFTMVWLLVKTTNKKISKWIQQKKKNLPTFVLMPTMKKLSWFHQRSCQLKKPFVIWEMMSFSKLHPSKSESERKNLTKMEETELEERKRMSIKILSNNQNEILFIYFTIFYHLIL